MTLKRAELAYGTQPILHDAALTIEAGERIALVGRNGTGKSTLMKVIEGDTALDDGECWVDDAIKISRLQQDVPAASTTTVYQTVAEGLAQTETEGDWQVRHQVERIIDKFELPGEKLLSDCSGGLRRRTMLARALVGEPDLLLLDEPTNHLDIASIEKLQELLLASTCTLLLVSHDRALIEQIATRIVELDRGTLTSFPGNFSTYQARRAKAEAEEADANRKFDQKLAAEEVWIRQGIKARRTRNEGRVRRLQDLRKARAARQQKQGNVALKIASGERSGNIVITLDDVSFGYAEQPLIKNFSTEINRGDRVAILGPNGSGKSTLIGLMLKEIQPQHGTVTHGTRLQIAYFDQHRTALNLSETVRNNVSPGSDQVTIGKQTKHIAGYLADFLFPGAYLNMPANKLSGGERNRLLMAKLFSQPANLLVLDEPTNDLDMETLELFEELLAEYSGTVILVSHDRAFIDAVATTVIAIEPQGVLEYVGGYTDWQRQANLAGIHSTTASVNNQTASPAATTSKAKKLGYKAQRELDALPDKIDALEARQGELQALIAQPDFYQQTDDNVKQQLTALADLSAEIDAAYQRWEALSELQN